MPELPEVETIRRQLEKELKGKKIAGVDVRFAGRLNVSADEFKKAVGGASVVSVGRRAKLLLLHLSHGITLAVHLKMTGRFLLMPAGSAPTKHTHLVFRIGGGDLLFFEDTRKFGYVKVLRTVELEEKIFAKEGYGPEPLDPSFTFRKFAMCVRGRGPKRIKPMLMSQTCIAGVGNIYADEACWLAKVRPTRRIDALKETELRALFDGVRKSMAESLRHRGTSADSYLDLYGRKGTYVPLLKVYGRQGEKCRRGDGGVIKKIRLAGRGAHFCPVCQK
jgi:formamidopyrimidine-DNA glycosylase